MQESHSAVSLGIYASSLEYSKDGPNTLVSQDTVVGIINVPGWKASNMDLLNEVRPSVSTIFEPIESHFAGQARESSAVNIEQVQQVILGPGRSMAYWMIRKERVFERIQDAAFIKRHRHRLALHLDEPDDFDVLRYKVTWSLADSEDEDIDLQGMIRIALIWVPESKTRLELYSIHHHGLKFLDVELDHVSFTKHGNKVALAAGSEVYKILFANPSQEDTFLDSVQHQPW